MKYSSHSPDWKVGWKACKEMLLRELEEFKPPNFLSYEEAYEKLIKRIFEAEALEKKYDEAIDEIDRRL